MQLYSNIVCFEIYTNEFMMYIVLNLFPFSVLYGKDSSASLNIIFQIQFVHVYCFLIFFCVDIQRFIFILKTLWYCFLIFYSANIQWFILILNTLWFLASFFNVNNNVIDMIAHVLMQICFSRTFLRNKTCVGITNV